MKGRGSGVFSRRVRSRHGDRGFRLFAALACVFDRILAAVCFSLDIPRGGRYDESLAVRRARAAAFLERLCGVLQPQSVHRAAAKWFPRPRGIPCNFSSFLSWVVPFPGWRHAFVLLSWWAFSSLARLIKPNSTGSNYAAGESIQASAGRRSTAPARRPAGKCLNCLPYSLGTHVVSFEMLP